MDSINFDIGIIVIDLWLIVVILVIIVALLVFIIERAIRAHRLQVTTGQEELVGKAVTVEAALDPKGTVLYKGERWTAISEVGRVEPGEEVIINRVDSLKLYVNKKQ